MADLDGTRAHNWHRDIVILEMAVLRFNLKFRGQLKISPLQILNVVVLNPVDLNSSLKISPQP